MAYNFKKINDVPVVEAMMNDLNVFVEDGRKMAKIPANKMIPEDVALKSDIPTKVSELENDSAVPVPATAEVGQVVAVKAVDENGKPTEWEAIEVGGGEYDLLFDVADNALNLDGAYLTLASGDFQEALAKYREGKLCKVGLRWNFYYANMNYFQTYNALAVCGMVYGSGTMQSLTCMFQAVPNNYFPESPFSTTLIQIQMYSNDDIYCSVLSNEPR